ncbi:ComEA family DNA-binding protein [Trinickia dinghuensis]|uniref:ComEA family DNA-binding protein n=1 Tax=Trinickia dinghuensis TaxID=2291023 RepID=A0A3D8JWI1_9BURK|nr:ComEA family DNA-binding protein [Trinickia dinghuensis]RDU97055.1 ComEA family DNA-binding protein [Trinickia dinghuensis]
MLEHFRAVVRFLLFAVALAAAPPALFAHAANVDVNTADEAALRAIKGIGPAKAKAIVDERATGGFFKDADDLGRRVKGLGGRSVERLRAEGLTVGGVSSGAMLAERPYAATGCAVLYNRTDSHCSR